MFHEEPAYACAGSASLGPSRAGALRLGRQRLARRRSALRAIRVPPAAVHIPAIAHARSSPSILARVSAKGGRAFHPFRSGHWFGTSRRFADRRWRRPQRAHAQPTPCAVRVRAGSSSLRPASGAARVQPSPRLHGRARFPADHGSTPTSPAPAPACRPPALQAAPGRSCAANAAQVALSVRECWPPGAPASPRALVHCERGAGSPLRASTGLPALQPAPGCARTEHSDPCARTRCSTRPARDKACVHGAHRAYRSLYARAGLVQGAAVHGTRRGTTVLPMNERLQAASQRHSAQCPGTRRARRSQRASAGLQGPSEVRRRLPAPFRGARCFAGRARAGHSPLVRQPEPSRGQPALREDAEAHPRPASRAGPGSPADAPDMPSAPARFGPSGAGQPIRKEPDGGRRRSARRSTLLSRGIPLASRGSV